MVGDLSADWLSAALGVEVRSVTAEAIGTGQIGSTYRLTLEGDPSLPPTLVAKLAGGDEVARQRVADGYAKEVGFYRHLAPTLEVRTPGCWYAAISGDRCNFTLLLDDQPGKAPGVQADGCSVEQADDAVRNLAGLHAPRWCDPTLREHAFLAGLADEGAGEFLVDVLRGATAEFAERYGDALGADDVATLQASAEAIGDWQATGRDVFGVLHGDYRLDNLMFPPAGPGVVALDWQTAALGPPGRDIGYFLGNSLATDARRANEEALVATYHSELMARGVEGYTADRCWDDYRLGQLQGPLITVLGAIYATAERSERADGMFVAMATRCSAAIRDLRTLDLV